MDISIWIQVITLFICLIVITAKDYYETLGVKRDASNKVIKRRFRQLGMKKRQKFLKKKCFNEFSFSFKISSR